MNGSAPFENRMTRTQTVLGWVYFPFHFLIFPLLLQLYALVSPVPVSGAAVNLVYHGVGVVFVLCVMLRFLRDGFDVFLDSPGRCLLTILAALLATYLLSLAVGLVMLLLLPDLGDNPNNAEVVSLAGRNFGVIAALTVFLGPIVEEALFRGVVFGSIRSRSRVLAYAVSALLFALYHVWQYALGYADPGQLAFMLQYIPMSLALAWCYERTGSIWTPIFFHMGYNALAFSALRYL